MQLQESIRNVIQQLSRSLEQLSFEQYAQNCKSLTNATIGQHVRHIIELYQCLHIGYDTGKVNYDERKRDINIELNKTLALSLLSEILSNPIKPDKKIILEACYDEITNDKLLVESNYYREVIYNLEHIVHHMALIRVGIQEISNIHLEKGYGVASSTIKYKQQCAQ
jgi:hypothetical protein